MARRASKQANRRARQQRRAAQQRNAPAAPQSTSVADAAVAEAAVVEAPTPTPAPRSEAARRSRAASPSNVTLTGSTLTASERSEYHYVERDLRNIGILSLVMVGLLLAAWALFTALGIIG